MKSFESTLYHKEKNRKWSIWVEGNIMYRNDGLANKEYVKKPSIKTIKGKQKTTPEEQAINEARKEWVNKIDAGYRPLESDEKSMKLYKEIMEIKNSQGGTNHGTAKKSGKGKIKQVENSLIVNNVNIQYPILCAPSDYFVVKREKFIWEEEIKQKLIEKNEKNLQKKITHDIKKEAIKKFHKEYIDATQGVYVQPKLDGTRCVAFLYNDEVAMFSRGKSFSTNKQFIFFKKLEKK